jgi:hypothetical protein
VSRDPIIDEVRAIRDEIAREHDYDLASICRMLREREAKGKREYVVLQPRRLKDAFRVNSVLPDDASEAA